MLPIFELCMERHNKIASCVANFYYITTGSGSLERAAETGH